MHTEIVSVNHFPEAVVVGSLLHDQLAELASQALIAEAELTPKPGLVDRRGTGAHSDLSLDLMYRSAISLKPYFREMARFSYGHPIDTNLRETLALIGRRAEQTMYAATGGSNAHKGAIWILGLLAAAAVRGDGQNAQDIAMAAGAIARLPDRAQPALLTHGEIARLRYGAFGARGEASNNFPHIGKLGLPTLRGRRAAGFPEQICRLDALFSIMAHLNDTCVLYRGGVEALHLVKSGAHSVLAAGGTSTSSGRKRMGTLDGELIARNVSPGGSADLLAATIFLDAVDRQQTEVSADQSGWFDEKEYKPELEEIYGAA
jgi:triphosphoribosyl-dephospho-CoA synthase